MQEPAPSLYGATQPLSSTRSAVLAPSQRDAGGEDSTVHALGVVLSIAMRAVGFMGVAAVLLPLAGRTLTQLLSRASFASTLLVPSLPVWHPTTLAGGIIARWLALEGTFLLACWAIAQCMAAIPPSPRLVDAEQRRLLWRRVLDDRSLSSAAFVASWFCRSPHRRMPALFVHTALLLRWVKACIRGRALPQARAAAPVLYEELTLDDVMSWASWGEHS